MKSWMTVLVFVVPAVVCADEPVSFSRDVLPILSANCFACHGPDEHERQAELRLDLEAEAKKPRDDGNAITPGSPDKSSVIARLVSTDPDLIMPPPKSKKTLTPTQIATIQRWISQGAKWERHWSFEPVNRPAGTLDDHVRAVLGKHGLSLQKTASPEALVRRLSLDIIGLPPTLEQAEQFASNPTPAAYEKLVG